MCGIAGLHDERVTDPEAACRRMLEPMASRGPDGRGTAFESGFAFGHLRLAIVDLAPSGHQPMRSGDGRWLLTFNGEIYNHRELRARIDAERAPRWRGHSDTEVLVEAIALWGVPATLERVDGMFAFAALEIGSRRLVLARDRFGEKPLCWMARGRTFAFASEVRALERLDDVSLTIDREALARQYSAKYVAAPASVYREIAKLPPGCTLEWSPGQPARVRPYWSAVERALEARARPFADPREGVDALEAALVASVARRRVADVPLGAFLSGGIDSSTVVALMQAGGGPTARTFSIGFEDPRFDESPHARAVAAHLGTDHHEWIVTGADALGVVPTLGAMFDEPFADSSQIPMHLVSRLARESVTVCLSGDGGDELFCGYTRYPGTLAMWRALGRLPLRGPLGRSLAALPAPLLERVLAFLGPVAARYTGPGRLGPKIHRLAHWMSADSLETFYRLSVGRLPTPPVPVLGVRAADLSGSSLAVDAAGLDPLERLMLEDVTNFLPDDILTKVDRATMAVSLEGRMPLLDPAVHEVAWRLPLAAKYADGQGKRALREVLYRHVPRELVERPKRGFSAPLGDWIRGPLREWANDLLSPARLEAQGLYDAPLVGRMLDDLLAGRVDRPDDLWNVLMVQAWLDADGARASRVARP